MKKWLHGHNRKLKILRTKIAKTERLSWGVRKDCHRQTDRERDRAINLESCGTREREIKIIRDGQINNDNLQYFEIYVLHIFYSVWQISNANIVISHSFKLTWDYSNEWLRHRIC